MSNKAHNNNGLRTIVQQRRDGVEHSSAVCMKNVAKTYHALYIHCLLYTSDAADE